ncbi:MAG TPA: hypothetical protein VK400_10085, partial [Pyrinomonadaceae bacterium]|nr:hypothetical protein [Pyrinomonadaceae bacterium]
MLKNTYSVFPAFLLAVFLFVSAPAKSPEAAGSDLTSRTLPVYSISGQIRSGGAELSGVKVTLSGDSIATSTTDDSGIYHFFNIYEGDTITITPTLANYIFSPPSRTFTNFGGDQNNVNFTATEICPAQNCLTNGRIAFVRGGDIYTSNHAGAELINLTNNPANDTEPFYSPDGSKIVFISNRDGNDEIYLMDAADGGNLTRLTTNTASDFNASFSPGGTKIIFASDRHGNFEIYTMNADGTNPLRLTDNPVVDTAPSF